jgi:hypothetical protein
MLDYAVARDGEEFAVHSNWGDWLIAWLPPTATPDGIAHGANAFCVTADCRFVLISGDGERWGWPGRPTLHNMGRFGALPVAKPAECPTFNTCHFGATIEPGWLAIRGFAHVTPLRSV